MGYVTKIKQPAALTNRLGDSVSTLLLFSDATTK
jgi:hypothetical protein